MPKCIYKTTGGEIAYETDPRFTCHMLAGANRVQTAYGVYNPGKSLYPGIRAHNGIDIDTQDTDTRVHSTVNGKVVASTIVTDKSNRTWEWGHYVCVQDTEGYKHYFCHLASRAVVVGQQVAAGDVLGVMGKTGNAALDSQAEHVHYEVRKSPYTSTSCVNPTPWCGMLNRQGEVAIHNSQCIMHNERNKEIMPASTKAVRMWFGAMSAGDMAQFDSEFNRLGVSYTDKNGVLTTNMELTPEKQTTLMSLAVELGNIDYGTVDNGQLTVDSEGQKTVVKAQQYVKQAQAALAEAMKAMEVKKG